jgi:hypothetical protein
MGSHKEEGKKSNYTHRDVLDGMIDATDKACWRTNSRVTRRWTSCVGVRCVALVAVMLRASAAGVDWWFWWVLRSARKSTSANSARTTLWWRWILIWNIKITSHSRFHQWALRKTECQPKHPILVDVWRPNITRHYRVTTFDTEASYHHEDCLCSFHPARGSIRFRYVLTYRVIMKIGSLAVGFCTKN